MRLWLLAFAVAVTATHAADNAVERGLQKAGKAVERGAKAAGRAVDRAATATQKGAEKAHDKIDERVRPQKKK
ncbi:MAG: hypothetical protein OEO84_13575 [Betaproteobacteria bacterium]|nr:hypothetical protein [Betaproteobacteria bacterium]